ncbi:Ig-like domain-containing protein [Kitasatospora sp. NPDC008050]|uniref:Ig-like domain-containing protein n=1 Tax=Kitasatospora sp. NPDC008050 TaxID=3364021 RepID=UPI0036E86DC6
MPARSPRSSRPGRPHRHRSAPNARHRSVVVAAALALGLTVGWLPTASQAQQSPDTWSGDQRAVLRSGLTVDLDFAADPGVTAHPAAGRLDERTAASYTDGVRPGAAAETVRFSQDRPAPDGSWRTLGTLQLSFSRPVRNPRLHISGLAGVASGPGGRTSSALRLSVTGGSPGGPALTARSPWDGWTVGGGVLGPGTADGSGDASADPAGSLELDGTFDTAVLRIERRDTAAPGSTTAPPDLRQAFTVTLDETLGSAPTGYGNASHVVSDLFLGSDALGATSVSGPARRSSGLEPLPPELQPGRVDHVANDPAINFPQEAAIGGYYDLTVPVSPGPSGATLAGWIDFDRDGRFDATERAQVDVQAGATSATLEWVVPPDVAAGDTWARLRLARDPSQVVAADGFADAGEVEDQAIQLSVGAATPEITSPLPGAAVSEVRPRFGGDRGVPGATVAVQEDGATICRATVDENGGWSCRATGALAPGAHTVRPAETTSGGVLRTGDPVRITVSTAPPTAPVFTLPEYTNDPELLLTGTGGPGSTVSVTEGSPATELCRTAVKADRTWSCLPVEELAEGPHVLTATALDPAGNRAAGHPRTLIVRTVPPAEPVITSPGPGEELHLVRPRLTGRGDPGATVTVVAGRDGALCSAVAAVDGSWVCHALRDLREGEQLLTPTATDRAGNATTGDPVRVRVVIAAVAGKPSPSASASASLGASPSASPSPSPSASVTSNPTPAHVAAPQKSTSPTSAPSPTSPVAGSSSPTPVTRLLGPPPAAEAPVVRHTSLGGWRAASCGVLLILTGLTLITRRMLARGSGSRRR